MRNKLNGLEKYLENSTHAPKFHVDIYLKVSRARLGADTPMVCIHKKTF